MPEKFKQCEKELENLKSEILNLTRTIKLNQNDNEKLKTEKVFMAKQKLLKRMQKVYQGDRSSQRRSQT